MDIICQKAAENKHAQAKRISAINLTELPSTSENRGTHALQALAGGSHLIL